MHTFMNIIFVHFYIFLTHWITLCHVTTDFDDFILRNSSELLGKALYSLMLTFTHNVNVESIGSLENQGSCSVSNIRYTNAATIACTDFNYATSHVLQVRGLVTCSLTGTAIPLEFIVNYAPRGTAHQKVTIMQCVGLVLMMYCC